MRHEIKRSDGRLSLIVGVRLSPATAAIVDELAETGYYGLGRSGVVRTLVEQRIHQLVTAEAKRLHKRTP